MKFLPYLCFAALLCTACGDKDDPIIENEEEIITDLVYTLIPPDNGAPVVMRFSDPDGDGDTEADITVSGTLAANTVYDGILQLTNASDPSDPEDVTAEILQEAADHQFYFVTGGGLNLTFDYADTDSDGDGVGVQTEVTSGDLSSGTLEIILRHEPNKASGATISDPTGAGGETDIAVTFPVSIAN